MAKKVSVVSVGLGSVERAVSRGGAGGAMRRLTLATAFTSGVAGALAAGALPGMTGCAAGAGAGNEVGGRRRGGGRQLRPVDAAGAAGAGIAGAVVAGAGVAGATTGAAGAGAGAVVWAKAGLVARAASRTVPAVVDRRRA